MEVHLKSNNAVLDTLITYFSGVGIDIISEFEEAAKDIDYEIGDVLIVSKPIYHQDACANKHIISSGTRCKVTGVSEIRKNKYYIVASENYLLYITSDVIKELFEMGDKIL